MNNELIARVVEAHRKLAAAIGAEVQRGEPLAEHLVIERGWVPAPLSEENVAALEALVGFSFPKLLRELLATRGAVPEFSVAVPGVFEWSGSGIFEKNKEVAAAREEYDWDLPPLVAITADEDFLAVTEEGDVVRVSSNEGLVEKTYGTLDEWLDRYCGFVEKKAADPEADLGDDDGGVYV
jgi:hypothetical protein